VEEAVVLQIVLLTLEDLAVLVVAAVELEQVMQIILQVQETVLL
tara:strand:- start:206 stop:337 length:132 start_codon:yes stop_codon:yes gene_type:complete